MSSFGGVVGVALLMAATAARADSVGATLAPPSFESDGTRVVYPDFWSAEHRLVYDVAKRQVRIHSEIWFEQGQTGRTAFDLVSTPVNVQIDHEHTTAPEIESPQVDKYSVTLRALEREVAAGPHKLEIDHVLTESDGIYFNGGAVRHGFYMSDFGDREYLEQYLPTSFEYDMYAIKMDVQIVGGVTPTLLFANGTVTPVAPGRWRVEFPEYFTSSSMFFHLRPEQTTQVTHFALLRKDGTLLPVTIFKPTKGAELLADAQQVVSEIMPRLEARLGRFPHPELQIQLEGGGGGMEHSGATVSGISALEHEIAHSYFARGVMPANGNSGWIDEAMASWISDNPGVGTLPAKGSRLAGISPYMRGMYGRGGYSVGSALLDSFDKELGDFDAFLRAWSAEREHQPITNAMFQDALSRHYGRSFDAEFAKYVFGPKGGDGGEFRGLSRGVRDLHTTREDLLRLRYSRD